MTTKAMAAPLTDEQRGLVERNLGLVAVHLRRNVPNLMQPRREREWDDLFQEGTLGLIQAARKFNPDGEIPFAAFAFPRIHNAVSTALRRRFSLIRGPSQSEAGDPDPAAASRAARAEPRHVPTVSTLAVDPVDRHPRLSRPDSAADGDTLGQRFWDKHVRTIRRVGEGLKRARGAKADRGPLIDRIVEERTLVPEPEARTPLREIARQTGSSYARVAQTDKQVREGVRAALEGDPEFAVLSTLVRADAEAGAAVVDPATEERLADAGAEAYMARLRSAESSVRDAMAHRLLALHAHGDLATVARTVFRRLSAAEREALLSACQGRGERSVSDPGARLGACASPGPQVGGVRTLRQEPQPSARMDSDLTARPTGD